MTSRHLGVIAYNAYKEASGGKSLITGEKLPEWDNLPAAIQGTWTTAAMTVARIVLPGIEETETGS